MENCGIILPGLTYPEEIFGQLDNDTLNALNSRKRPGLFHNTLPSVPSYYVSRTLTTRSVLIPGKIFDEQFNKNNIFLFACLSRSDLSLLAGNIVTGSTAENLRNQTVRYLTVDEGRHYDTICENTNDSVHYIQKGEDGRFSWVKSRGRVEAIQNCLDTAQLELTENDFFDIVKNPQSNTPVCISDSPGMGKSTLLAQIGNKLVSNDHETIVIFVVISEFIEKIRNNYDKSENKKATILEFLKNLACKNNLSQLVFQQVLDSEKIGIELLLDGFDEVGAHDISLTNQILTEIKGFESIRAWVTSRPHLLQDLENTLGVLGYNIKPFNRNNQLQFLQSYWSRGKELSQTEKTKLQTFASHCLERLQDSLEMKDVHIAGIPLQCLLIGEVYDKAAMEEAKSTTKGRHSGKIQIFSISHLYDQLVENKYDKYIKRVDSERLRLSEMITYHKRLSLQLILPNKSFQNSKAFSKLNSSEHNELLKLGIVEAASTNESPRFIHRTFAEYFVAALVADLLNNNTEGKILDILLKEFVGCNQKWEYLAGTSEYLSTFEFSRPVIIHFLNALIKDIPVHGAVITRARKLFSANSESKQEIQAALQASIHADCLHVFTFLNKITTVPNHAQLNFNFSSLHFALKWSSLEMVKHIWTLFEKSHELNVQTKEMIIEEAVIRGNFSILEYLMKEKSLRDVIQSSKCLLHRCISYSRNNPDYVIKDKIEIVKMLLGNDHEGKLMKEADNWGRTPLLSYEVHVKILVELLILGADPLAFGSLGQSVLHLTNRERSNMSGDGYQLLVSTINDHALKTLVRQKGKHSGKHGENQDTPLLSVLRTFDPKPETLRKFKEVLAQFNAYDESGKPVLAVAILNGRSVGTLQALISYGANVQWAGPQNETLLHLAAVSGHIDAVEMLISSGYIPVNAIDSKCRSPLHYALESTASRNLYNTGLVLLKHGASFQPTHSNEEPQLHTSVKNGHFEGIRLLIYLKCYVNESDGQGDTPLHVINYKKQDCYKIASLLISNSADVNRLNDQGETPLHLALLHKYDLDMDTFQLLMSKSNPTWTPKLAVLILNYLLLKGDILSEVEATSLFHKYEELGVTLNEVDEDRNSFLHIAAYSKQLGAVKYLLDKGANVNQRNNHGQGPLHKASLTRFRDAADDIIKYLIEKGADVYATDSHRLTFLDIVLQECDNLEASQFHGIIACLIQSKHAGFLSFQSNGLEKASFLQRAVGRLELLPATLTLMHKNDVDFSEVDGNGDSVLMSAVSGKRSAAVLQNLVQNGASSRVLNKRKENALHKAAAYGSVEGLSYLLENLRLDVNAQDIYGNTPLHHAVVSTDTELLSQKVKLLHGKGAKVDKTNKNKMSPLALLQKVNPRLGKSKDLLKLLE